MFLKQSYTYCDWGSHRNLKMNTDKTWPIRAEKGSQLHQLELGMHLWSSRVFIKTMRRVCLFSNYKWKKNPTPADLPPQAQRIGVAGLECVCMCV